MLLYLEEMGAVEQNIAQQAQRAGMPMPERIANAPQLTQGLQLFYQAFMDLDSERSHGTSPTPIPWTSIAAYADVFAFDEEQRDDLFFFVRRMDNAHLDRIAKKMKAAAGVR